MSASLTLLSFSQSYKTKRKTLYSLRTKRKPGKQYVGEVQKILLSLSAVLTIINFVLVEINA